MIRAAKSSLGEDMMRLLAIAFVVTTSTAAAAPIPIRTPIGSFPIDPIKSVTHVEATRVDFLPGQQMPEHMHPVPVVCFVSKGSFLASIGREPVRKVTVGDTTLERAGEVVHYFRNISSTKSAQLYCATLAGPDDKQLSVMLSK
jgi:quercetin dioxygenase-like cupin family protein